jgi:hypothetical protein
MRPLLVAGLVLLAVALVVGVDRAVARGWFDRRRPRPDRRTEGVSVASGMLGDLVEIFQPSRTHVTEEQERRALDIRQTPDTDPPLDLDTGVVVLPPRAEPGSR